MHLQTHDFYGPFVALPKIEGEVEYSLPGPHRRLFTRRAAVWAVDLPDPRAERTTVFATERERNLQTVASALEIVVAWCVPWDEDMAEAILACARIARRADPFLSTLLRALAKSVAARP